MSDLVKVEKQHGSIEQLMKVSNMLADGKMFVHPSTKKPLSPGEVFSIVEYGREVGLEPVMSLQNISIVNGRLCMGGAVMLGIAKQHGVREEFIEESKERCEVKFEREGHKPYTADFTMEDAKKIKVKSGYYLADKDVWKNYPSDMLKWRAVAKGLRVIAADVLAGLYLPEEIENIADAVFDYTPIPEDKKEHFDQKKNGFLDDDAPEISPVSKGQVGDPVVEDINKFVKEEVIPIIEKDMGINADMITENQIRAYHAITDAFAMREFEKPFKIFLLEAGMVDGTMSMKSMTKDNASKLISGYKEFFKQFIIQDHLHSDCLSVLEGLDKVKKDKFLQQVNAMLDQPVDISTINFEKEVSDHFSLMALTLSNQIQNNLAKSGMTTEQAVKELEELGLEPQVVETMEVPAEQPKKAPVQDSFL